MTLQFLCYQYGCMHKTFFTVYNNKLCSKDIKWNHNKENCCCVMTYRSKWPPEWPAITYNEVVEEAQCFGWTDSALKRLPDGRLTQNTDINYPKFKITYFRFSIDFLKDWAEISIRESFL